MAGAIVLFSFPCCILPSVVHLFAVPMLLAAPAITFKPFTDIAFAGC